MLKRAICFPLWAGPLLFGGLAPTFGGMSEALEEGLSVEFNDGLVSVLAHDVPRQDVIREVAAQCDLRLVQYVSLERSISLDIGAQPLHVALAEILEGESYQLYQAMSGAQDRGSDVIPGTLWVFSEGSSVAPAATLFLEAVFYQGDFQEKKEAIRELRRLGNTEAVRALSLALSDDSQTIRNTAFEALESIASQEALAAIASAVMDSDPRVRGEAIAALAAGDGETSARYLTLALNDPDPRVRVTAIEALADVPFGSVPSEQAVAALSRALKDDNSDVRMQAIESLEEIGGEVAFQTLTQARSDEDSDVADSLDESLLLLKNRK